MSPRETGPAREGRRGRWTEGGEEGKPLVRRVPWPFVSDTRPPPPREEGSPCFPLSEETGSSFRAEKAEPLIKAGRSVGVAVEAHRGQLEGAPVLDVGAEEVLEEGARAPAALVHEEAEAVPPERMMSEAAPLRKACHEHRSMPREGPLRRSLRVAPADERPTRMGSWRRPPRRQR